MKMKWQYKGMPLAHPVTILRRLLAYPLMMVARCLLFVAILAGWGMFDAVRVWKETA